MKRVYVAGAYSAPDVLAAFANIRRGMRAVVAVRKAGFAAYNPWADICEHLLDTFSLPECYAHAMTWLEACDAVLVVPEGADTSHGTKAEVTRALDLGLPVIWEPTVASAITALQRLWPKDAIHA